MRTFGPSPFGQSIGQSCTGLHHASSMPSTDAAPLLPMHWCLSTVQRTVAEASAADAGKPPSSKMGRVGSGVMQNPVWDSYSAGPRGRPVQQGRCCPSGCRVQDRNASTGPGLCVIPRASGTLELPAQAPAVPAEHLRHCCPMTSSAMPYLLISATVMHSAPLQPVPHSCVHAAGPCMHCWGYVRLHSHPPIHICLVQEAAHGL